MESVKSHLKELWSREGQSVQLHNVQQKVTSGRRDVAKVVGVCRARMGCIIGQHVVFGLELE